MSPDVGPTLPLSTLLKLAAPESLELPICHLQITAGEDRGRTIGPLDKLTLIGREAWCDVVLDDPAVSGRHCEVRLERGAVRLRDRGATNGTFAGPHRVIEVFLEDGHTFRVGQTTFTLRRADESRSVDVSPMDPTGTVLGRSEAMLEVLDVLQRIAGRRVPVLLTGETGTGKTCVARALHAASGRSSFVQVNCGALPEGLIESELFGHEKGAFTGADARRVGLFEAADGGTIFLDEIGDLPLHLQPRLLTVLEDSCVRPVGSSASIPVDFRLVAATHRSLEQAVADGAFREDLYYRLSVVPLELPPLRRRAEDLPLLAEFLLARAAAESGDAPLHFDPDAIEALRRHDWPGNVRELDNVIRRAVALAEGAAIGAEALRPAPVARRDEAGVFDTRQPFRDYKQAVLDHHERRYLDDLMAAAGGSVSAAARRSGLSRQHVFTMLKRHGLRGTDESQV
jgi:DNA-binding NtrC family response regulator